VTASPSILVRGGGVAGLACAVTLAERGALVTLAEAGPAIGSGASWKAGGMLAPWCEAETAPPGLTELALPSLAWWRRQVPDTVFAGTLVLALSRDSAELGRMARRTAGHRSLDEAGIAALEPSLAGRFSRGLFYPDEAHLDPRRALPALAARLIALGGKVLTDQPERPPGTFDHVVDTRGFADRDALRDLRGVRGEMLMLRARGVTLSRPVRLLHPRFPVYLVPRADGVVMLGATMIESEERGAPRVRSVMELLSAAFALHPAFGEAEILEIAADLRPSFGDNMPRIVRDAHGLHVNGMYRHGFLLAPALAVQVADLLLPGLPDRQSS
jgi:glycine oxidase